MKRIYHNHLLWEDHRAGLFAMFHADPEGAVLESLELLSDPARLIESMRRACDLWPRSAEHNLSNTSINRQAWLGQAACCIEYGVPDYLTCQAWRILTDEQREAANAVADAVIMEWERKYDSGFQLALNFGEAA